MLSLFPYETDYGTFQSQVKEFAHIEMSKQSSAVVLKITLVFLYFLYHSFGKHRWNFLIRYSFHCGELIFLHKNHKKRTNVYNASIYSPVGITVGTTSCIHTSCNTASNPVKHSKSLSCKSMFDDYFSRFSLCVARIRNSFSCVLSVPVMNLRVFSSFICNSKAVTN